MKSFLLNVAYFCSLSFLLYNMFYVENPNNHQIVVCIFSAMVIIVCSLERATFMEVKIKNEDDREEYNIKSHDDDGE